MTQARADRDKQAKDFQKVLDAANAGFKNTQQKLRETNEQNQSSFRDTLKKMGRVLGTTEKVQTLSQLNLDAIRGNGSYPCVVPLHTGDPTVLRWSVHVVGSNALTGVTVELGEANDRLNSRLFREEVGTVMGGSFKPLVEKVDWTGSEKRKGSSFVVQIYTQNGHFEEFITVYTQAAYKVSLSKFIESPDGRSPSVVPVPPDLITSCSTGK